MEAKEESPSVPPDTVGLFWKDIWWIKSLVFFIIFASCYITYKAVASIFGYLKSGRKTTGRENMDAKVQTTTSFSSINPRTGTMVNENSHCFGECDDMGKSFNISSICQNTMAYIGEDELNQFYDLAHHGVQFYNDNMSSYNHERRQRMRSTVAETALVSMVRKRQGSGSTLTVLDPPAFPKIYEDLRNDIDKSDMNCEQRHFSSGDMRCTNQIQSGDNSVNTVAEEATLDSDIFNHNISYRSGPNSLKNCQSKAAMSTGNETVQDQINHRSRSGHKDCNEALECTQEDFNASNNFGNNNNACPVRPRVMTPCPSLVTEKNSSKDLHLPRKLICPTCNTKLHCPCKSCSAVCVTQMKRKGEPTASIHRGDDDDTNGEREYFPEIREEFIDDNFEDMESIVSGELN